MRAKRTKTAGDIIPTCDGQALEDAPPPSGASAALANARREFVAVYGEINRQYAQLRAWRAQPAEGHARNAEYELLQKIEKALLAKEELENRAAARGISVTPVYRDGFTIDLLFQHPGKTRYLVAGSSASRFIALPLPPGMDDGATDGAG